MPPTIPGPLPSEIAARLSLLERRIRRLAVLRAAGTVALVLAAGMSAGLLVGFTCEVGSTVRTLLLLATGLAVPVSAAVVLRQGWRRYSNAELAAVAELGHAGLNERLISLVEMCEAAEAGLYRGSPLMRELLLQETCEAVARLDFSQAVSSRSSSCRLVAGSAACLALMVPFALSPAAYGLLLNRYFTPWRNLDRASNLYFEVQPGNCIVARGTNVVMRATPHWRSRPGTLPQSVWLNWTSSSSTGRPDDEAGATQPRSDKRRMDLDADGTAYVAVFPRLLEGFDYTIGGGPALSRRYRVDVADAPALTALRLKIVPPAYTGLPPVKIDGVTGRITVFERSRLQFQLQFNKPVKEASLVWCGRNGGATARNAAVRHAASEESRAVCVPGEDRRSATLEIPALTQGGPFEISLIDEYHLVNPREPDRQLVVIADQPPQVSLMEDRISDAHPQDEFKIAATARDDIAVASLELRYRVNRKDEQSIVVPVAKTGTQIVTHRFSLELADLKLVDGDIVTCRVRAADARPEPGPQVAWSETHTLTIRESALPAGSDELSREQADLSRALAAIQSDLKLGLKTVGDLYKAVDAAGRYDRDFTENERLPDAAARYRVLRQKCDQVADELDDHPLLANIAADLRRIADHELRRAPAHIEQAHRQPNLARKRDLLEESRNLLAAADRAFDEVQRQFDRQRRLEQDLLELNRMAHRAKRLAESMAPPALQPSASTTAAVDGRDRQTAPPAPPKSDNRKRRLEGAIKEQEKLIGQLDALRARHPELQQAAQAMPDAEDSEEGNPASPRPAGSVPADVAQPIADARAQLAQAGDQLGDLQESSELSTDMDQPSGPGSLQDVAASLNQAAELLTQAAQQSQPAEKQSDRSQMASDPAESAGAQSGPTVASRHSTGAAPDLSPLESSNFRSTGRRWGELPGKLQTEILNGRSRTARGDYAPLIKDYFQELARPRNPNDTRQP